MNRDKDYFGINAHLPDSAILDKCRDLGVGWIRVDFNWHQIEAEPGRWAWGTWDRIVREATARGLRIFATLSYSPGWANGNQDYRHPPTDRRAWKNFVGQSVERFGATIKHWGMWNEPNHKKYGEMTPEQYVDNVLKPGAEAAKKADEGSFVLGPDLTETKDGKTFREWMPKILNSAGDRLDIITHHIYRTPSTFEFGKSLGHTWLPVFLQKFVPSLRGVMMRHKYWGKDVWITETGWQTAAGELTPQDKKAGKVTEKQQAAYYTQLFEAMSKFSYVKKIFAFDVVDDPPEDSFWGLLHRDGNLSPKPAFAAYRNVIGAQIA